MLYVQKSSVDALEMLVRVKRHTRDGILYTSLNNIQIVLYYDNICIFS